MYFICTEYVGSWPNNKGSCLEFYRTCSSRLKEQEAGQDSDRDDDNDNNDGDDNDDDNDNDSDSNTTTDSPEDDEPLEGRK